MAKSHQPEDRKMPAGFSSSGMQAIGISPSADPVESLARDVYLSLVTSPAGPAKQPQAWAEKSFELAEAFIAVAQARRTKPEVQP